MKAFAICALVLTFLPSAARADDSLYPYRSMVERAFRSGGSVRLSLSAGDYRVRQGEDGRLRVLWSTRKESQLNDVDVDADVRGSQATIQTDGPRSDFKVIIELPQRSDLYLRMSAGDLRIEGIEGNKDVRLRAGDLSIDVADPASYRHVEASVTAGDLRARPFGVSKGGLWRSFTHDGAGRYTLRASVWAGDLTLRATRAEATPERPSTSRDARSSSPPPAAAAPARRVPTRLDRVVARLHRAAARIDRAVHRLSRAFIG